jgi:hypothetical protein
MDSSWYLVFGTACDEWIRHGTCFWTACDEWIRHGTCFWTACDEWIRHGTWFLERLVANGFVMVLVFGQPVTNGFVMVLGFWNSL